MAEPNADVEDAAASSSGSKQMTHMPRKRAAAPRFDTLPEFRSAPAPPPAPLYPNDPVQRLASISQPRAGPEFIRYSLWVGGAAVAYTYLAGFRAMIQKNEGAWRHTFRQRLFILGPLMSMYAAGSGLVPLPFRGTLEEMLARPAISLGDVQKVEKLNKQAKAAATAATAQRAADAHADQHVA